MAQPIVEKIGQASKDVWPQVSESMSITHHRMIELAEISEAAVPLVEEYVARGNGAPIRRRKVCEETIWALARLGWLRTGNERDVVLAAKAVADGRDDDTISDDEFMAREDALVTVVLSSPEYLFAPKEATR